MPAADPSQDHPESPARQGTGGRRSTPAAPDAPAPREQLLAVRIRPRSRVDAVVGERQGVVEIRLRAAPVDGAANAALSRFLADRLGVPLRDVVIASGQTSPCKRIRIQGQDAESVRRTLLSRI
ncbi:MAG: DUF167 domain-containing protein [Cyanobacteriota bacterium]|nr:DUF167 domain-containing protein [Cyanobacteriota bacterium]